VFSDPRNGLAELPTGTYSVMLLDVDFPDQAHGAGDGEAPMLSLVILDGPFQAQVVSLPTPVTMADPLLLLGAHAALEIADVVRLILD
jgi:hypothetical protein